MKRIKFLKKFSINKKNTFVFMTKFLSFKNKIKDFVNLKSNRKLIKEFLNILKNQKTFDYGGDYFYQSSNLLKISGLRDTGKRIKEYRLQDYLLNKNILDIGTNTGFFLLELDQNYNSALGVDYNENLIKVANKSKEILNNKKVEFKCSKFEDLKFNVKFDFIFSCANHSTYDKGINSLKYFDHVNSLLDKDGYLFLESHHPKYENHQKFVKIAQELIVKFDFQAIFEGILKTGKDYDDGRSFYLLKKN